MKNIFRIPPTILVDMDGVLGWWEKHFIAQMKSRYPHVKVWEFGVRTEADQPAINKLFDLPEVQDVLRTPGFYAALKPIAGGFEALEAMRKRGFDVAICTAPSLRNPTCASDKYEWILRNFGSYWADRTIITKEKWRVDADLLVDDKSHVAGTEKARWSHLVFDQSYNRGDMTRPRMLGWTDWERAVYSALHEREKAA